MHVFVTTTLVMVIETYRGVFTGEKVNMVLHITGAAIAILVLLNVLKIQILKESKPNYCLLRKISVILMKGIIFVDPKTARELLFRYNSHLLDN